MEPLTTIGVRQRPVDQGHHRRRVVVVALVAEPDPIEPVRLDELHAVATGVSVAARLFLPGLQHGVRCEGTLRIVLEHPDDAVVAARDPAGLAVEQGQPTGGEQPTEAGRVGP
jgi:hypothetical protein